jgi:KipI family sensor histidine kinase inhibitor
VRFEVLSETMLLLRVGSSIHAQINADVHALVQRIRAANLRGITDIIPAYAALAIHYDPALWQSPDSDAATPAQNLAAALSLLLQSSLSSLEQEQGLIEIPVCYGGEFGPDLDAVAEHCDISTNEVIARHSSATYQVAMLGFAPGFPYLLGLDPTLHVPRRTTPRVRVPAQSVAIGGAQTGIYPRELPGGWSLIGRTPRCLFDPARNPPSLLAAGQHVRFVPIDRDAFARIESQSSSRTLS